MVSENYLGKERSTQLRSPIPSCSNIILYNATEREKNNNTSVSAVQEKKI